MRPSDVEERIKESSDSGIIFTTNILLLFVNTICEQNKPGTCKTIVLPHLLGKTLMREIYWCGFITNCLKTSKITWDETDRENYYCGPLLLLLVRKILIINTFSYIIIRKLINHNFVYTNS